MHHLAPGTTVYWSDYGRVLPGLLLGVIEQEMAEVSVATRGPQHEERKTKIIAVADLSLTAAGAWHRGNLQCTREYVKWQERARYCTYMAEAAAKSAEPLRSDD